MSGISNATYLHDLHDEIESEAAAMHRVSQHRRSGFYSQWSGGSEEDMDEFIDVVRDIHGQLVDFENTDFNKRRRLTVMSL